MRKLPKRYTQFMKDYPAVGEAYEALGRATQEAGPLDPKSRALVKVGISVGAKMEGATRSHVRRSLEAGAKPDEIRHVALLATTTLGFPSMMAALGWIEETLRESGEQGYTP
jgi:4-carboxymuconolactone decarboxylase